MKFASFKFALLSLLAGVFALALAGCGASNNLALPQGNWSMTANSSGTAGTFYIGGNLVQTGTNLAGTMAVVSSLCYSSSQTVTFTGTVKGHNVTLTSASVGGEVITVTVSGTSGSALTGTYSIAGGTTCNGDKGSVTANPVPSVSATWSGPIGSGGSTLAIAFTEASTPSADGTFALTGSLTYAGSSCSTGTIPANSSFIVGPYLVVNGNTVDGESLNYTALLNNPASPTSMTGTYQTTGGTCDDFLNATFTKK
jgi:hypothetical protein